MSILDFFIGSALAQEAAEPSPVVSSGTIDQGAMLIAAAIGVVVVFRIFTRGVKAEPWLVGAALLAFAPIASYVLLIATNGHAAMSESLPWLFAGAIVLGGAWWWLKSKARLTSAADPTAVPAPEPAAAPETAPQRIAPLERPAPVEPQTPTAPVAEAAPNTLAERIFISYRRQDSADVTGRLYDRLVQRFGKDQIFKDVDSIPLGVDFREHLGGVVGRCNLLLAVIGDQWAGAGAPGAARRIDDAKDFVRLELEAALERGIPVIPVLVRGALLPEEGSLPASLARLSYRHGISVRPDPDFHRDVDRLVAGIEAHLKA